MDSGPVVSCCIGSAMEQAERDKLEGGSYGGGIPACMGVIAFGRTLRQRDSKLRATLEDWTLVGLKLGHRLSVVGGIDLNLDPRRA